MQIILLNLSDVLGISILIQILADKFNEILRNCFEDWVKLLNIWTTSTYHG